MTVRGGTARGTLTLHGSGRGWTSIADTAPVDEQIAYLRRAVLTLDHESVPRRHGRSSAMPTLRLKSHRCRRRSNSQPWIFEHIRRAFSTGTIQLQLLGIFLVGLGACLGVVPTVFELV